VSSFYIFDHIFFLVIKKVTERRCPKMKEKKKYIFGLTSSTARHKERRYRLADDSLVFVFFLQQRVGESGRRLMHLVPAPAVRLMKRRVHLFILWASLGSSDQRMKTSPGRSQHKGLEKTIIP
jgi:hypothetical protein